MDKKVLIKYINYLTFLLMLDVLIKVVTDNAGNLKVNCILLIVYVLIDIAKDIWDCKGDIKREITLKYVVDDESDDKQGEK